MKILLDECVTKKVKPFLPDHNVFTVSYMKWNGLRNGTLMDAAIEKEFDALLTIDKKIHKQQNIQKRNLIVVILDSKSSKVEEISKLIPEFLKRLPEFEKGNAYLISG